MNKYVRQFFGVMFQSQQTQQAIQIQSSHMPASPEAWRQHWQAQGQSWRTEPEIDAKRQEELSQRRTIIPDIEKGIYPFKGMKLSRADVEWLLAGQNEQGGSGQTGLDLRGADLSQVDLRGLPLAGLRGGLASDEWRSGVTEEQCRLAAIHLEGANLQYAHLEQASLRWAHLEGADFSWAYLNETSLRCAHLEKAHLRWSTLNDTTFCGSHMEDTDLRGSHLAGTDFRDAVLSNTETIGPHVVDVDWGGANLAVVKWLQVKMLGDEHKARQRGQGGKKKDKDTQLTEYEEAVRANRQLAVALQTQGLNEDAARFAYRAQVLQKTVFGLQMIQNGVNFRQRLQMLSAWLFSWFLFLLAGYGYKPGRSFLAYLFVIIGFATSYYLLGLHDVVGPHHVFGPHHLTWYEAIVVSMTAFHGRGFFANQFQPGDPQAFVAAFEAFVGLLIEVTFIATLTRRLFGQ